MARRFSVASGLALCLTLVVGTPSATAQSGLEDVVGAIPADVAALLPTDPAMWSGYDLEGTPDQCRRGDITCVNATIRDMENRFDPLASSCNHNAVFSLLYLRTTQQYRVLATTPGALERPATVNREDTDFAELYFQADDNWYASRPATVPPAWRLAFAAADDRSVSGTGDALLGMAAHIRRDLPFGLWRIAMGSHNDHESINQMLKQVYNLVLPELARRFDPTINPTGFVVPGSNELVVDAIAQWREKAWYDAQDLINATDTAQFNDVAMRIERDAWMTSQSIYLGARNATDLQRQMRDDYCAAHWNS